jgi:hypothetical protein
VEEGDDADGTKDGGEDSVNAAPFGRRSIYLVTIVTSKWNAIQEPAPSSARLTWIPNTVFVPYGATLRTMIKDVLRRVDLIRPRKKKPREQAPWAF